MFYVFNSRSSPVEHKSWKPSIIRFYRMFVKLRKAMKENKLKEAC